MSVFVGNPHDGRRKRTRREDLSNIKFRFIAPPTYDDETHLWVWPHLRVDKAGVKGDGLFATEDIERGLLIPYNGDLWTSSEYDETQNKPERVMAYALNGVLSGMTEGSSKLVLKTVVSADPENHACENHFCIAGMVNEASMGVQGDLYNAEFVDLKFGNSQHMPHYGAFMRGLSSFMLITTDVKKGSEILCWYGAKYDRGEPPAAYVVKNRDKANMVDHEADADTLERFRNLKPNDLIYIEGGGEQDDAEEHEYEYDEATLRSVAASIGMGMDAFREYMKTSYNYDRQHRIHEHESMRYVKLDMARLKKYQSVWAFLPSGDEREWMNGIVLEMKTATEASVFMLNTNTVVTVNQSMFDTKENIKSEKGSRMQYVWQAMVDENGETDGRELICNSR